MHDISDARIHEVYQDIVEGKYEEGPAWGLQLNAMGKYDPTVWKRLDDLLRREDFYWDIESYDIPGLYFREFRLVVNYSRACELWPECLSILTYAVSEYTKKGFWPSVYELNLNTHVSKFHLPLTELVELGYIVLPPLPEARTLPNFGGKDGPCIFYQSAYGELPCVVNCPWITVTNTRHTPPSVVTSLPKPKPTYIYMMKDNHTGCIKIGRSKSPEQREKTLQSEKPSIEMLGHWPGSIADEKRLHAMYAHKRVRGEWFRLSRADIRVVRTYCETMTNK